MDKYDNINVGDIMSLNELKRKNPKIYENSVKEVETGNTLPDGTPEIELKWRYSNG